MFSKSGPAGVTSSVLLATTGPLYHMHCAGGTYSIGLVAVGSYLTCFGMQVKASLALVHSMIVATSALVYCGAQKSLFFGIYSTIVEKAQVADGQVATSAIPLQGVHMAAVCGPVMLSGWQIASEKSCFGLFFS